MKVLVYSTHDFDRDSFTSAALGSPHSLEFTDARLDARSASLATGFDAVCAFVNDQLDASCLEALAGIGVRIVALRSAGFNHVDLPAAAKAGVVIVRVPAYSPSAVAEHTIGLLLMVRRSLGRAYNRVRDGNFALDGLLGRDLAGSTACVVGTGAIGTIVARTLLAIGCRVLVVDPLVNDRLVELGAEPVTLDHGFSNADIVLLHCPLTAESYHLVSDERLGTMRRGVTIVNTGRGALLDTVAVIRHLKTGHVGALALDVYEEEGPLFFADRSSAPIADDVFARLLTFPNVVVTGHQGFFTVEALHNIAQTTLSNLDDLQTSRTCANQVIA